MNTGEMDIKWMLSKKDGTICSVIKTWQRCNFYTNPGSLTVQYLFRHSGCTVTDLASDGIYRSLTKPSAYPVVHCNY